MLTRLTVRNFKSLRNVTVELPRLAVFFDPNGAGKSNLLDAIQALSWIGNARTVSDALSGPFPVRGYGFEAFSFGPSGVQASFRKGSESFVLEADLANDTGQYRYRVEPRIDFRSGHLSIADEYLVQLGASGKPKGTAAIERIDANLHIRRKGKPAHPRQEEIGLNHAVLSDRSLTSSSGYPWLEQARTELADWRTYYLEPRMAMRAETSPADVYDIGIHGEDIAPFLYKLRADFPKHFDAVSRALRSLVPSVEGLAVELDERRGTLNLLVRQSGVEYSSRVLSEGTLRVLALCAITVNPWTGSLVALEEPENGVHARRLELIARLLLSLADQPGHQVVVTTHSPLFVDAVLRTGRTTSQIGFLKVSRLAEATVIEPFNVSGPLLQQAEIDQALESPVDDGTFESRLLRGWIHE
jgi:predicted ATPase